MPPFRDLAYETGWVYQTDWTTERIGLARYNHVLNADEDTEHGMSRNIGDHDIEVWLSPTGTWNDAFQSIETVRTYNAGNAIMGASLWQVDMEHFRIHTGPNGSFIHITPSGGINYWTGNGYFNIIVRPK